MKFTGVKAQIRRVSYPIFQVMDNLVEQLKEALINNDLSAVRGEIDVLAKDSDWTQIANLLRISMESLYQKHWLKTNHVLLSLFMLPELLGIDCNIFSEISSMQQPRSVMQVYDSLFELLVRIAENQIKNGGSTLFFNVERMSSTRSAIIIPDLIEARYRETLFVLQEIDNILPKLTKEWVDVSRLWRTSNGFRLLKVRNIGTLIHINEYKELRNRLIKELNCDPTGIEQECDRLQAEDTPKYLQLSQTLEDFMTGLIASLGIRGKFDQYYKTWIDHEGLDEF